MERSTDVSREIAIVIQALIILLVVTQRLPLPTRLRWPVPARVRAWFAGAAR